MRLSVLGRSGILVIAATTLLSACSGAAGSEISGVGGTVWVSDEGGNSITVINAATNQVIATLNGIEGAHDLQAAPDGKTAYATNGGDNTVSVIDIEHMAVISTVASGEAPTGISFSALSAMPPSSQELQLELSEHQELDMPEMSH